MKLKGIYGGLVLVTIATCSMFYSCKHDPIQSETKTQPIVKETVTVTPNPSNPTKGMVVLKVSWGRFYPEHSTNSCVGVATGLGYSSNDVANEAYFTNKDLVNESSASFENLAPGIYYWGAKTYSYCGPGPTITKKQGAITVTAGYKTEVSISLN